MNGITETRSYTPVPLPGTGPTDTAQGASVAATSGKPAAPFAFVNGEPPPDVGQLPPGSMTSGLKAPSVSADQWLSQASKVQGQFDAFNFGQINSTTEAMSAQAQIFAMQDVLIKLMILMRSDAMKNRDDELKLMIDQKTQAIAKSLDAAKLELTAGIVQGASQIVSGGFAALGGLKGEGLQTSGVAVGKYSGSGTSVAGALNIGAAVLNYGAATERAAQQRLELGSEAANARMQQSIERMNTFRDVMKSMIDAQLTMQRDLVDAAKRSFA
ncbi:MAG: hypothetical protein WCK08_05235 [Betaproteobacteria bacterium]